MTPPNIVAAAVDWPAALKTLGGTDGRDKLAALNVTMGQHFPGSAQSPVPVLLPFDADASFQASKFFDPGPAGYDAAFTLRTADVPELADIKFAEPIEVQITGSRLVYRLGAPTRIESGPRSEPELEPNFPGIRRLILEHHLRYAFERYGATYVVSIACFDAGVARYKMPTCRAADRVAIRFLNALKIAGGAPEVPAAEPVRIERPSEPSGVFSYFGPGRILSGTGFRGEGGRVDATAYSQIRFPLADAPAYANTQMFQRRNPTPNYAYPWRDNFCERRGFPVGQCPAGVGHQGQDIRAAPCMQAPRSERCERPREIVAARDGAVWPSPRQEAVHVAVTTASEHIRFRYLHMIPRDMDNDNLLSGRRVRAGETIGHVGNFSNKEGGTSYHLHFDVQVFTSDGWVFVNPYMTLVNAYERLIHGRGEEITDPALVGATEAVPERPHTRRARHGRRIVHRPKPHRRSHLALH